eukprot:TRINITY_DN2374_c0_g1_i1.p1 TRINITY_DN2374_c0_g1~~TRINITY_DN2374_c0_g1_i1.p1  ORF type:complete len:521 (+),score=55.18 TRINITY_DN2374_c0_g1_i1:104-1666(+)
MASLFKRWKNRSNSSISSSDNSRKSLIDSPSHKNSTSQKHASLNESDFQHMVIDPDHNSHHDRRASLSVIKDGKQEVDLNQSYLSPPVPTAVHPLALSTENSATSPSSGKSSSISSSNSPTSGLRPSLSSCSQWRIPSGPNESPSSTPTYKCPVCSLHISTTNEKEVENHVEACLLKAINTRPNMSQPPPASNTSFSSSPPSSINKYVAPRTFTYSSNSKPLFEESPQQNRRQTGQTGNSVYSSPIIPSTFQTSPNSQAKPQASSAPTSNAHPVDPNSPFAIRCPYRECKRLMEAKDFYQHAVSSHASSSSQSYACPICQLMGMGNFVPSANTNLYEHVRSYHVDLGRVNAPQQLAPARTSPISPTNRLSAPPAPRPVSSPSPQRNPAPARTGPPPPSRNPAPNAAPPRRPQSQASASSVRRNPSLDFEYNPEDFADEEIPDEEALILQLQQGILPTRIIGSKYVEDVASDNLVGIECTICFEEFEKGDRIARMDCFCTFHIGCIETWFEKQRRCPLHKD